MYIYMYGSILTVFHTLCTQYFYLIIRDSTLLYIYIPTHSTERMGEGEMRKKHERVHTAGEEWSNEVALIQALRK